jgi:glutamate racemase
LALDNRPIGVFDSGLGGLTAVKEMMDLLPNESIVYFGDTGRVPYGTRSKETIIKYAKQDIRFLLKHNIKAIVIACGTVSSVALNEAIKESTVPTMGVVEGAVLGALNATKNKIIGILGTSATIRSEAYEKAIRAVKDDIKTVSNACPLFVPLVENGYFKKDNEIAILAAKEYLKPLIEQNADTIILGCTHYPLLKDVIASVVGQDVTLIDPGKQAAMALKESLKVNNMLSLNKNGEHRFYVSDSTENFSHYANFFLGKNMNSSVEKIDIETY